MTASRRFLASLTGLCALILLAGVSQAAAAPVLGVTLTHQPELFPTGAQGGYTIAVTNTGNTATTEPVSVELSLPNGLKAVSASDELNEVFHIPAWSCSIGADSQSVSCTGPDLFGPLPIEPGAEACEGAFGGAVSSCRIRITVAVEANLEPTGPLTASVEACEAGVVSCATAQDQAETRQGGFTILDFSGNVLDKAGGSYTKAGGHPYSATTRFEFPAVGHFIAEGGMKDIVVGLPPGFVANPAAVPAQCTLDQLMANGAIESKCPINSQMGVAKIIAAVGPGESSSGNPDGTGYWPDAGVFRMQAPFGKPALFAFKVGSSIPIYLSPTVRSDSDYGLTVTVPDINQTGGATGAEVTIWGVPADPSHDVDRGGSEAFNCPATNNPSCSNPATYQPKAFVTNSTNCSANPLKVTLKARSWEEPDVWHEAFFDHDTNGNPIDITECDRVPFDPTLSLATTTDQAETPTGLEVDVKVPDVGLLNPEGVAQSHVKKATVTLPEGVTINPSVAEGLGVCSPAQFAAIKVGAPPGSGCPNNSRLGSVEVETPLLEESIPGSVYLARQDDPSTTAKGAENPFDSLLAIYVVAGSEKLGLYVKLAGEVETDEQTGRLFASFDDLPQLPFSNFRFKFREGARAPLVSPPACGTYATEAEFVPWSAEDPENPKPSEIVHSASRFKITRGVGGGACPPGGVPPFKPGFSAGSINNNAGSHTEFTMRLTRNDGEQNMTRFSAVLPPGVLGKLAGVQKCSDAAIALAKSKTGKEEIENPSCPAGSQIGRSLAGAGVGSVLTYVPGKIYLGGPVKGKPLSVIAITPVVAGPFDVGTVVVREALTLNPTTAEVEVDGGASDPIPHILEGIPAKLRDLRVYVDRPEFIINPTSCDPSATDATLFGSYLNVLSPADDVPVSLADRFQAASCQSLGFKPKLNLTLKGGTKRGGHPGLVATYRPRSGDANLEGVVVRLPSSAFLDQAHIRTICTRVQFAADSCPKGAQYGFIKAWTPLLDEPLQGPVWLRSSNHKLPDLVFDLHGLVDVEVATRIDSARGGIRATVESAPDAPLAKVLLRMQGGKKGLIVNSRNLCGALSRANVEFSGHNGKQATANPAMRAEGCGGKRKGKRGR